MGSLPFFQLYPADYLRDTRVLSCAAKGGWMDALCMLHGSSTRGTMTLPVIGWARVFGASVDQAEAIITEIEMMRVADVTRASNGDVTLSCRRMLRERITREQTRLRVQRHRSNMTCNAGGNASETHNKLETRNQNISDTSYPPSSSPSSTSDAPGLLCIDQGDQAPRNDPVPFAEIVALYNELCPSMPRARISDDRKKSIRARWLECQKANEEPLAWFRSLFTKAEASDFLSGRKTANGSHWRCSLDWLMGPKNAPKVMEGNYENRGGPDLSTPGAAWR